VRDGLNGFATLRTPSNRPPATEPKEKRRCPRCGGPMSDYATGVCFRCQKKEEDQERERDFAQARARYRRDGSERNPANPAKPKTTTEGAVMHVAGGIELIPEPLPGRQSGGHARDVYKQAIEAFLASGVECARVEVPGVKRASSAACGFREVLGNEKRCYAAVRAGRCYLVRVKK